MQIAVCMYTSIIDIINTNIFYITYRPLSTRRYDNSHRHHINNKTAAYKTNKFPDVKE